MSSSLGDLVGFGQPYHPIPSGEIAEPLRYTLIRPVAMVFTDAAGVRSQFNTDRAFVVLARLREAARAGEEVTCFEHGDRTADIESLAGLNCYLRTARAMGRMKLPFDRLGHGGNTRYEWADFCTYLGLNFR